MPSLDLDTPIIEPAADKINVQHVVLYRTPGPGVSPHVRVGIISGYYLTDAEGNRVLNPLGFDTFIHKGWIKEYTWNLTDPEVQAVIAAREVEFKTFVAEHPEVPLLVVVDNYLTQLSLDMYQSQQAREAAITIPEAPIV